MTPELSDVLVLVGGSVAVYAGLPLLYTLWRSSVTLLLLYVHLAAVLTFGGIMGAVFVIPLYDDVTLLGGQLAYAGFMFTALLTVIVGHDVRVLRNIILLTVAVNLVKYVALLIADAALQTEGVINPFGTSSQLFDQSTRVVLLGGLLNIVELVLLLGLLEWAKIRVPTWGMRSLYVLAYMGILVLDGVLFPALVLAPQTGLLDAIAAGVQGKAVMALVFGLLLAAFVVLDREDVARFESTPLRLTYLVSTSPSSVVSLLEHQQALLARQRAHLDLSNTRMGEVSATVESLLDSAVNTVLIAVDRDLRVTHFSAGAHNTLGYEARDVVGNEVQMLLEREEVRRQALAVGQRDPDLSALVETLASTGARGDWSFRTVTGEARTLSISVSTIDTDHGVIGHVLAGEDVTDRLRVTQSLADALVREHESLEKLQSADQLRNELVFTVSHELSTPITSIAGYLEMLQESGDALSSWQQDALERATRNTVRLRRLVEDLRLISQVDTGELGEDRVELDLRDVVAACRDQVEESLNGRELELDWRLPEQEVPVHGDAVTLREVVLRLASNAVKFTPDGGRVVVEVGARRDGAVLTVSDTGIGIPSEDQRRIFDRFQRGSEVQKRAIQGAGLGLSIVSTVVRRHGGDVEVESAPREGTTIRVVLPLANR